MSAVDIVLIGRNEGSRLVAALASLPGQARQVVYVDSGSTDSSVAEARRAGAQVVELDMSVPFTAARARNAGFAALTDPDFVMFVDGDCTLVPGFVSAAVAHLSRHPELALVTGWRSEIHRDSSIFNQLCDFEWRRPVGRILGCGGDMLVRAEAFRHVGGFGDSIIASEDEEFGTRLRKAGWALERLPLEMTRHDADMHRFGQWWRRAVRTGHGFAHVGHLHPDYFARERQRVLAYALVLPLLSLALALVSPWLLLVPLAIYALNYLRTQQGLRRAGLPKREARQHALFIALSKFPNLVGMATYHLRRLRNAQMRIIEYK
ncbi:MAG TPA: glycosyltransferase family 2 protein [Citreicella sp.]|uniref:Glycosyltransferase like family 2 n=1 Tax=Salipiger marinus TaxID=555512 RepID=A0A1G8NKN8_9RHOB|nr:glycosyltransferase family A protein [Salipiger marinus]SDI80773.1 Glycosyltransferase like family 2 [Salipiger marinus]HBM59547.1 glycosyltransferase family 2 protein [Citreicella sp.]HBT00054.1 glycosyltransferase family 2 protein [Citreicella sp.]